jgi:hypothetical protein
MIVIKKMIIMIIIVTTWRFSEIGVWVSLNRPFIDGFSSK